MAAAVTQSTVECGRKPMMHCRAPVASTLVILALLAMPAFGSDDSENALELKQSDVFVSGTEGYHTFRIPALVVSPKGTLLAFCEGRKTGRGDHGDIDLVLKRSTDGGQSWQEMQIVYEEGGEEKITIGNPCPVVDADTGTIWLPFTRDNDDVLVTSSDDDGVTWSKPRVITSSVKGDDWDWYATGPGNGIQLTRGEHKGRLVIPCDHRVKGKGDWNQAGRSHVIYSDDHGRTWQLGGVTDWAMNECAAVELSDGRLMLNMRSYRGKKRRGVATSDDGGQSWSEVTDDATLIEPVCQASLIRYSWPDDRIKKSLLLFSNPASESGRVKLTVRLSEDEGATWPVSRLLYERSSAYSSLAVLADGQIGVLYERDDYGRISLARFGLEWLRENGR
jgi:sialidase-1